MIKLALTDLDDTLIAHGNPGASPAAISAIHEMLQLGLHFGPVSGRVPCDMAWMFDGDESCIATGAYVNGQIVTVDGEITHVERLDGGALEHVAQVLETKTDDAILTLYDLGEDYQTSIPIFVTTDTDRIENCRPGWEKYKVLPHVDRDYYVKSNVLVGGTREHLVEVRDLLRAECPELDFVLPSGFAPLVDISPAGWDKGSGVRCLAETLGVTLDEVATFGDSENDLAMIKAVPNSVAVANASADVQAAARWHIGASADDAVANALQQIADAAKIGAMPKFMR